jgi:hypothetical protein
MLQPDVGQLLQGLRVTLRDTVLPAVGEPAAQRQLKAALHLLGRLGRCWDLPHILVRADNVDIDAVIAAIEARMIAANLADDEDASASRLPCPDVALPASGVNVPQLAEDMARNLALCRAVEALEHRVRAVLPQGDVKARCLDDLHALFARMAARESILVGDVEPSTVDMDVVRMKA